MSLYSTDTANLGRAIDLRRRTHYIETAGDDGIYTLCVTLNSIDIIEDRNDRRFPWYAGATCRGCCRERMLRESLSEAHRLGLPHVEHDDCPGELGERFKQVSAFTETEARGCPVCGGVTWARYQQVAGRPEREYLLEMHANPWGHDCRGWRRKALYVPREPR